ncbi:proline/glycine betaine ABC transporter permease [Blautia liquoris]|uniref:Proline/glycine betaine ABC transporter permease n=1 Tax=Blautia liquoris TaxID=2779518 RepID=A0A7M2RFQ6_9FIRM|nr:proline/glycine betaine ABC transporter permease [Blautia liquoris]QOV19176.1 proline/glycine betaine ABC transporter permease [Blautia liquoris]
MSFLLKIPIGDYAEKAVDWLTLNFSGFFDGVKVGLESIIEGISWFLMLIPIFLFVAIIMLAAWWLSGTGLAIFSGIGLLLIDNLELWQPAMETVSLVITTTLIAMVIGLPVGIWMSLSNRAERILRPILDFMQTMPAFVYLIPAVYFFDLGTVPGAVSTVIFAMPPIIRLTNLGIREVSGDLVEAAKSFGSTTSQMLFKIQVPLAMPTILAGLNQTIMLSLSMVVISAMIGADGLGKIVLQGITQMRLGDGLEGGIAVVIIAMILDRLTQGLGKENNKSGRMFIRLRLKKQNP